MRQVSTLILITFLCTSVHSQQWRIISGYSLGLPKGEMKENIPPAHSLQPGVMYRLPGPLKQLFIGLELGIGVYANKRIEQTFQFNSNVSAVVPVNYSSNVFNGDVQLRLNLLSEKNPIIPYIQGKAGVYNFYSNIYIEDPHDPDGCSALQQENIINDKTPYWSAGGGLHINLAKFSKKASDGRMIFDFSANTIRGGTVDYINTKRLMDAQSVPTTGTSKPLKVEFINASTREIHEHTVAQVYTSPLSMFEFRAGFSVALGRN